MNTRRKQALIGIGLALAVSISGCVQAQARPSHHRKHHSYRFVPDANGNSARPRAWCGWYLARYLGLHDRRLWIAREWARQFRHTSAHIGAIAVWPHHVGVIVGGGPGHWLIHSGNDGHRVRTRERSTRGVIAFVEPHTRVSSN